jgi:hypothetical protein
MVISIQSTIASDNKMAPVTAPPHRGPTAAGTPNLLTSMCAACRVYPSGSVLARERALFDLQALQGMTAYSGAVSNRWLCGAWMVQQEFIVGGARWVAMSQDPSVQALDEAASDPWVIAGGLGLPPPSSSSMLHEAAPNNAPDPAERRSLVRVASCEGGTLVLVNCSSIPPVILDPALSQITGNALQLHLLDRRLAEVPSAIGGLTNLEVLAITASVGGGKHLVALPDALCTLSRLRVLDLQSCGSALQYLPRDLGNMAALEELRVGDASRLQALPNSMTRLSKLRVLDLQKCSALQHLPRDLGNLEALEELRVVDASRLQALFDSSARLTKLRVLDLSAAFTLRALPSGIEGLTSLEELDVSRCRELEPLPQSLKDVGSLKKVVVSLCHEGDPQLPLLLDRGVVVEWLW